MNKTTRENEESTREDRRDYNQPGATDLYCLFAGTLEAHGLRNS